MGNCLHEKVVRRDDGNHYCDLCEERFFHLDTTPGKITVMEPYATLRDQFAMAALTGTLHKDVVLKSEMVTVCAWAYVIADEMMKARTQ